METKLGIDYLNTLLDHAFDLLFVKQYGVNHAEHIFSRVLDVLINDKELKIWFLTLAEKNLLSDEQDMTKFKVRPSSFVDPDLIFFIAHATKWQEFRIIAQRRKEVLSELKTLNHTKDFSENLLESLEDNWEDSDFYQSFQK